MPHLLAADLGATANRGLRDLACLGNWYQLARGDARSSHDLAARLYQQWRERLGGDDPSTFSIAVNLAATLQGMGHFAAARELDEDTLARKRRVLGEDHPNTLNSANMLAVDLTNLGEHQAARELDEDTLARRRRVLGDDHRRTPPTRRTTSPVT